MGGGGNGGGTTLCALVGIGGRTIVAYTLGCGAGAVGMQVGA